MTRYRAPAGVFLLMALTQASHAGAFWIDNPFAVFDSTRNLAPWTAAAEDGAGGALASRGGDGMTNQIHHQYLVKPGETIYRIAKHYGISPQALQAANGIVDPRLLQSGQMLVIPDGAAPTAAAPTSSEPATAQEGKPAAPLAVFYCTLTAYTSGPESTGKSPGDPGYGVTASGRPATPGRTVAVDPNVIPIGTKLYIEGIGYRVAEDTGGAIRGRKIDIYMTDVNKALQFGVKRDVPVYIVQYPSKSL
ncbi:MAG: LysM peptidoglycan-binding domain-containing protein [Kyrpidia tusciae]|nr:3D domain-containing protein [Kyrpidia tusciae]MBE3552049.1 LysM peptidoglycan-binding domain-containing protein [Kyrpidia tusciae]